MIVGITGSRGAGKDTLAGVLVNRFGFSKVAFADELYAEVASAFSVSVELLQERSTKEQPLACLALEYCSDPVFAQVVGSLEQGITAIQPLSPRLVLQAWGFDYRQRFCGIADYFVQKTAQRIQGLPGRNVVVTDVRFKHEAKWVCSQPGAKMIRVRRAIVDRQQELLRAQGCPRALHCAETELLDHVEDITIFNEEGSPQSMEAQLEQALGLALLAPARPQREPAHEILHG